MDTDTEENVIEGFENLMLEDQEDTTMVEVHEEEMYKAEISSMPESSKRQMEEQGAKFLKFVKDRGTQEPNLKDMSDNDLNSLLRLYYYQLKTSNGELYAPASLVCIRAGIQRYISVVYNRNINLVAQHTAFDGSNRMLACKIREYIKSGKSAICYDAIEDGDMAKLKLYFDRKNGEKLQDEMIFRLLYEFGERGQEHLKYFLQKNTFLRNTDADGRNYVTIRSLPSKNRTAKLNNVSNAEDNKFARMYDLELFDLYEKSIPESLDTFLPRPMASSGTSIYRFSAKAHRGLRFLQEFMKNLSSRAKLSRVYTNHCIR
jgi:hypothetical protein